MPGDDLLAELESLPVAEEAPAAAPRRGYARTTVLAPVDVVGDPSGRRGTSTMGDASLDRIEEGPKLPGRAPTSGGAQGRTVADEMERAGRARARTQELARRGYRDTEHAPISDALQTFLPVSDLREPLGAPQQRTTQRISEAWDDFTSDPGGTAAAAAGGALRGPFGVGDEMIAGGAELWQRAAEGLGDTQPRIEPQEMQRGVRRAMGEMRDRSPYVADTSRDVAGTLPWLAAAPQTMPARAAMGVAGGTLAGIGARDAESPQEALDAGIDALPYAAAGAVAGEAPRLAGRAVQGMAAGRDDALLAATGHLGGNRAAVKRFDFGDTPEQIRASRARSAQVLRDTDAVPRLGTMGQTRERVQSALDRATRTMDETAASMGSSGATRADVAARLRERAAQSGSVSGQSRRDVLLDFADSLEGADDATVSMVEPGAGSYRGSARVIDEGRAGSPITYADLMEEVGDLRQLGSYRTRAGRDVPMVEGARRDIDRTLRDAYDDAVEATLGADRRQAYRQARQQYATLRSAIENATEGEAAVAGNRGFGLTEQLAFHGTAGSQGYSLGGIASGAGAAAAANVVRAVGPRARASAAEYAYRIAQAAPQYFGRRTQALLDAGTRGPAALAAAHHVLTQTDAEYRQRLAELESLEVADDATPEAIRAIGESGEDR